MHLRDKEKDFVEVRNQAKRYFRKKYNCAQSVILAISKVLRIEPPSDLLKSTKIFTGGIGYSGCLCEALGGALLMIGYLYSKPEEKARQFFEIFKREFGNSCCRVLRKGIQFEDRRLKKHCSRITEETAFLLLNFIGELDENIDNHSHFE